jgi:hypothetical protein
MQWRHDVAEIARHVLMLKDPIEAPPHGIWTERVERSQAIQAM